ncbi:inactive hydroxysteroid dehydrogenase-like protein 1 [Amphiura filiformis]|uniref:inactive hydroxysteroid dehydrogenase-like protein 1 n=1 Tax=Amphiura filiformis TaxID=82378 RepID=UPI003B21DC93
MAASIDSFNFLFDEISKSFQVYNEAFALLGAYYVTQRTVRTIYKFQREIRVHFWSRVGGNADYVRQFGEWAVITGSTDGIGKAYAQELASMGVNIVLISRSTEKLRRVAKELESNFHVKTHIIKADFSQGQEIYPKISDQLTGLEVGILVNNVGAMDYPEYFLNMATEQLWQLININIGAATLMTKIVLPQMVDRRCGAVINISAGAAIHPNPQLAVYTASKTYMDYFSRSIEYEYKDKGIVVQSLLPSYVATKMTDFGHKTPKTSFLIPSASVYARHALATLGMSNRTTGYWPHTLQFWVSSMIPEWLWLWGASALNSALRRQAKARKRHHSRSRMAASASTSSVEAAAETSAI